MSERHVNSNRKYLILAAALLMTLCLGATYAWSIFVPPLKAATGLGQGAIQKPFTIFYIVFPVTLIFSGTLFTRLGPRRCALIGGLLFGGGWMLAGLGEKNFLVTTLGIGVLGGMGVGFAYIVPIATSILWFPRRKGLITGVAVAGFGGGAALVSQFTDHLMSLHHASPYAMFHWLGLTFLCLICLASGVMSLPPTDGARKASRPSATPVLRERVFWILYLAMFSGLAAGFSVVANLKQLYMGREPYAGWGVVALFALANALGRIGWGMAFDRMRAATAIRANLVLQAAVLLGAGWLLRSPLGLQVFTLLAGLNYGGVLVIYASTSARRWGSERIGAIYGWMFSANALASLAPLLVGLAFDRWGSFIPSLAVLGGLMLVAAVPVKLKE